MTHEWGGSLTMLTLSLHSNEVVNAILLLRLAPDTNFFFLCLTLEGQTHTIIRLKSQINLFYSIRLKSQINHSSVSTHILS